MSTIKMFVHTIRVLLSYGFKPNKDLMPAYPILSALKKNVLQYRFDQNYGIRTSIYSYARPAQLCPIR